VILWAKSLNRSCWFWAPNWKTNRPWFWGSTKKPVLPVSLCTIQIAHSDLTSWSSGHWVPDLCLIITAPLHQASYSCHDPRRCPPCRTCQLHTTRQANVILHTNNRVKQLKYLGFEFKSRQINDSSQENQGTDRLVSQTRISKIDYQHDSPTFRLLKE
jgi:hypothetical protein